MQKSSRWEIARARAAAAGMAAHFALNNSNNSTAR